MSLEEAVELYRQHVARLPDKIRAKDVLTKRPLPLYWSLGITTPHELADALVRDRSVASREMAMGYLYEIVLVKVCKARKLSNQEKKTWRGVDFRKEVGPDVHLLNLKSARATSNADISEATMRNLAAAAAKESSAMAARARLGDDNPLITAGGTVAAIRAVARGHPSQVTRERDGQRVTVLIGDSLWEFMGAGSGYGRTIQLAIGANPVDRNALDASMARAVERVEKAIRESDCVRPDGTIDWPCLLLKYPDA